MDHQARSWTQNLDLSQFNLTDAERESLLELLWMNRGLALEARLSEMLRNSVEQLTATIERANTETDKLSRRVYYLNWAATILGGIGTVFAGIAVF